MSEPQLFPKYFSGKLCGKNDGGGGGEEMYQWESEGV